MAVDISELYELFRASAGICTDTRTLGPGQIYLALKGPNFNGNHFAEMALQQGAAAAIVDEPPEFEDKGVYLVDDCLKCLQQLAAFHRQQFDIPVLGITGSNGKTTNKELIHAVLSSQFRVLCTQGNLNNHIGVPLTLLGLQKDHELAVIEMGANHIGEIKELCDIARPDHGMVTSIGIAHLEGFGSLDGVKKAKGELYEHVSGHDGTCFVNNAAEHVRELYKGVPEKMIEYGDNEHPPYVANMTSHPFLEAEIAMKGTTMTINSRLIGAFQADNLLNALVVGMYFKVPPERIREALECYQPKNNRGETMEYKGNTVVLDAYNANPTSTKAAIDTFLTLDNRPKMVILGDMFELGDQSLHFHQQVVDLLSTANIEKVILVGKHYGATKMPPGFLHFETTSEAAEWFSHQRFSGYDILVKGSRGVHLEVLFN